ncbi:hypothetical protein EMCRGX_G021759 [Ephydatia muelleri]
MIAFALLLAALPGLARSSLQPIVVDVDLSPGLVSVSLGCLLELECYGAGTAIQWTKFPSSAPLGNTTNTQVTVVVEVVVMVVVEVVVKVVGEVVVKVVVEVVVKVVVEVVVKVVVEMVVMVVVEVVVMVVVEVVVKVVVEVVVMVVVEVVVKVVVEVVVKVVVEVVVKVVVEMVVKVVVEVVVMVVVEMVVKVVVEVVVKVVVEMVVMVVVEVVVKVLVEMVVKVVVEVVVMVVVEVMVKVVVEMVVMVVVEVVVKVKSYAMNKWTTFLIFPYFTESLKGFYSCQIFAAVSNSMSVQLQFDPNPIQILNIPDLNISQYTVGDALTVGCQVTTCASQVTLTISPSLAVQQASITYMNTGENKVQNFVLAVNKNLAGTYMLTAEGKFSDGSVFSASQVFNIIGTPMPQVTTPSTATPSKGGSPASVARGVAARATEQRKHEANEQGAGCLHGYGGIWCLGAKAIESLSRLASCLATSFNKAKAVVLIVLYGRLNLNLVRANTTAILTRCLAPDM